MVRCWRVPGQIPCEVPECSGADLVRFRRVLAEKMLGEVLEGSGADALCNSKGFRFFNGISTIYIELWQTRRIFQAVGDST